VFDHIPFEEKKKEVEFPPYVFSDDITMKKRTKKISD